MFFPYIATKARQPVGVGDAPLRISFYLYFFSF